MHIASSAWLFVKACCFALLHRCIEVLLLHVMQAGDDKFKAELGWVVNLEMWDAAKQLAAQKLKGFNSQLASVTSQEQLRLTDLTRLDTQVCIILNSRGFFLLSTLLVIARLI